MPGRKVQWKSKTSWRAKLHKPMQPKLVPVPDGMAKRLGHGMMLIPTALELDAMIRKIPRGQVSTLAQIRRRLARRQEITPYWRVVRDDGRLNAKFPGGIEAQARWLREEGHTVENGKVVLTRPA